jgi:hypothetical protein
LFSSKNKSFSIQTIEKIFDSLGVFAEVEKIEQEKETRLKEAEHVTSLNIGLCNEVM